MNTQLKKGLLEYVVLAVLRSGESYGYQIVKDVNQVIEISESTLYPILKRLEKNNQVLARSAEYNGRLRKYYSITDDGLMSIEEFIDQWPLVMNIYKYIEGD